MAKKQWWGLFFLVSVAVVITGTAAPVFSQPMLKMVHIEAGSQGAVKQLAGMGLDIAAIRRIDGIQGAKDALDASYRV